MRQIRAVSLKSYLDVARFVGLDGLRLLADAGFAPSDLNDSERRLPAEAAVELLERSAELSGCDNFGILMAQARTFASLGPVALLLEHLPTVGDVANALMAYRRAFSDVLFVALEGREDVSLINVGVVPPYGRRQATDLSIGLALTALRGASSGRWAPEAVHFMHAPPRQLRAHEAFFRAPLQFDSSFNGFSCSTRSLAIALPLADSGMAQNAAYLLRQQHLPQEEAPLSHRVRQSILLLLPEGRATLQGVAANVGLTPRALQRALHEEGHTFAGLLNEVRRELARQALTSSRVPITEIAANLGYATPTSFARWFQAEFGTSPRAWRAAETSFGDEAKSPPSI